MVPTEGAADTSRVETQSPPICYPQASVSRYDGEVEIVAPRLEEIHRLDFDAAGWRCRRHDAHDECARQCASTAIGRERGEAFRDARRSRGADRDPAERAQSDHLRSVQQGIADRAAQSADWPVERGLRPR